MAGIDIDRLHEQRVNALRTRWSNDEEIRTADIFVSERVFQSLNEEKLLVGSFRLNNVLSLLPFVPNIYVLICPTCVLLQELVAFEKLTAAGLIIPVLSAPYSRYPEGTFKAITAPDHMSCYEYEFYRTMALSSNAAAICPHCIYERRTNIVASIEKQSLPGVTRKRVTHAISNLVPLTGADEKMLDIIEDIVVSARERVLIALFL
jgi:hypothetical protein